MYVAPKSADKVYVKYKIPLCQAPTLPKRAVANAKQADCYAMNYGRVS